MAKETQTEKETQKAHGIHNSMSKRLYNVEETAEYLGISPKTIRNQLGPKASIQFPIKPKRIGKRVLFDIRDIDNYIDGIPAR